MAQQIALKWKLAAIFGWHRLFDKRLGKAILFYLTCGGLFVWWIMDIVAMFKGTYFDED